MLSELEKIILGQVVLTDLERKALGQMTEIVLLRDLVSGHEKHIVALKRQVELLREINGKLEDRLKRYES